MLSGACRAGTVGASVIECGVIVERDERLEVPTP